MPRLIRTHLLASTVLEDELANGLVVVIDILRATTTITQALVAGATAVTPCLDVDEAFSLRQQATEPIILGGERRALPIPGFDLGNSPQDYTPERVGGKRVVITTTNGTRAIARCSLAESVFLGAFVNRSAVVGKLLAQPGPIHFLCAGTDGQVTREDVLFAGACIAQLLTLAPGELELDDSSLLALGTWESVEILPLRYHLRPAEIPDDPVAPLWLIVALLTTLGGRNLQRVGLAADVAVAARIDSVSIVPMLDAELWEFRGG